MKRLVPININEDVGLSEQVGVQTLSTQAPLSRDPQKYPVFRVPVNKKKLIYVPNHTVTKDGVAVLRMDNPLIHVVSKKNRFDYYRCISGLSSEKFGFDGTCPLCDAASDCWTLANYKIEDKCKQQGLQPDDKENERVKQIRSSAFQDKVVNDPVRYYTFPIVVFDTENDDGKTFVKDSNGHISFKVMWYSCSESVWNGKWVKALENMEDEPTHPGGRFFLLDYTYTPKKGEPNARDSARELTIFSKTIKESDKLRAKLDELTQGWTPDVARSVVIRNGFYDMETLSAVADEEMIGTRNLIEVFENKGIIENSGNGGFNLEKLPEGAGSAVTGVGETDEDFEIPME